MFQETGGVHGVAFYSLAGVCLYCAEDVGRHNACDKIIGMALHNQQLPLPTASCLVFSGRVSYELIQKAQRCNIRVIIALGAPSSLAVELTREYGIALIGFVRSDRFNVYNLGSLTIAS